MVAQVSKDEIRGRLDRTRTIAAERGFEGVVVIGRSFYDRCGDLAYLTNHFPPFPATVFSETQKGLGHGLLVLPVRGEPALVIDGRAYRKEMMVVDEVVADTDLARGLVGALRRRSLGGARVALVGDDIMPMAMYRSVAEALPALRLEPADEIVRRQRIVKSPAEQALLRRAAEVSDAGLRAALGRVREGATETDVCAHGIAAAMEAGADFVRYLRVHSGVYSSYGSRWPQALPRTMERGDLVAMDIIGAAAGYQFDVLRTTAAGPPGPEHRKVLDAVVHAADAAVAAARAGAVCGDLVRTANRLLDDAGYGEYARTFMGHGIGLETVEEPYLTPEITARLEPGMVICVEPGVYIPGWAGASVEHELIVTEGPPEVITPTPARQW